MAMQPRLNRTGAKKSGSTGSSSARRVKVVPYVVPTTRNRPPPAQGMRVPTRWVKFIVALFLVPLCALLSQTFFTIFTRATVSQRLWAAEEFWFFSLGSILWLIAFFGLPKPLRVYVFGHELTHAIWVWLMGGEVSDFQVGREGGHIVTTRNNFWIALAPYFFPIYSILVLAIYGVASAMTDLQPFGRLLYALIGVTWAFHLTFTVWMIPKSQSDLTANGTFFSLVLIYLINLLILCGMLILASPQIHLADFGKEAVENLGRFSDWIGMLQDRFARGYQGR